MPANPGSLTERKIFPMFSRWKTARTPRMAWAAAVSSLTTRPLAIVASTGTAYSIPGKWKSEVYFAVPVTLAGPSTRGVSRPIGDVVVAIFDPPVESACRRHLEGVGETAPGELDFERVLALGFLRRGAPPRPPFGRSRRSPADPRAQIRPRETAT